VFLRRRRPAWRLRCRLLVHRTGRPRARPRRSREAQRSKNWPRRSRATRKMVRPTHASPQGVPEAVLTSASRSPFALGLSRPAVASPAGLRADERQQTEVAQPELQEQGGDADAALGAVVAVDRVLDEAQPMAVDDAGAAPRVTAKRSARAAAPSEGGNRARGGAGGQHKGKANKCVSRGGLFAMCTASPAALCVSGLPFPHLRVCCVCVSSPRVSPPFSLQQGQCPGPGSRWQR
jgi:hypothetical protein